MAGNIYVLNYSSGLELWPWVIWGHFHCEPIEGYWDRVTVLLPVSKHSTKLADSLFQLQKGLNYYAYHLKPHDIWFSFITIILKYIVCMGAYGCVWVRMGACGCVWVHVGAYGCVWVRMGVYGCVCFCSVMSCGWFLGTWPQTIKFKHFNQIKNLFYKDGDIKATWI